MAEGFDFSAMLQGLNSYTKGVQQYLSKLESSKGSSVNLADMFTLQYKMQVLTQYTEAVSNTMSAVHNEMVVMARATKGQ